MDGNLRPPIRLAFSRAGDGPPLLFLAGLGCDRDFWGPHVPLLSARASAITPDNRGSGESPAPPGPYTAREMADDALALLDELGVEGAHVAGHSLGGMVALEMALAAPSRVLSLVLAATAARPHPRTVSCLEVAAGLWEAGCAPEMLVRTFLTWTTSGRCLGDGEFVRRAVAAQLAPRAPQPLEAWKAQAAAVTGFDARGRLGALRCPTLVVAGEEDVLVPLASVRELASEIPGAVLEVDPGTGHNGAAEDPAGFCGRLLRFLPAL